MDDDKAMDDERISAFLDRELTDDQREDLEQAFAADAGAAARLRLVKRADDLLRRAMDVSASPSDHALGQRILNAGPIRKFKFSALVARLAPLAAACALGFLLGSVLRPPQPQLIGVHRLASELLSAIESAPSGESRTIAGSAVTLAQTIRTKEGYCRQLRIADTTGATDALVCLRVGGWRVVVAAPAIEASASRYSTAAAHDSPFDVAVQSLGDASFVDEAQEATLIRNGWRSAAAHD